MRGGENKEAGLMVLALENLFSLLEISKQAKSPVKSTSRQLVSCDYKIYCSIVAVHQSEVYDLLANKGKRITVLFIIFSKRNHHNIG